MNKLMVICEVCNEMYWFDDSNLELLLYSKDFHCHICDQYSEIPFELKFDIKVDLFRRSGLI